MADLKNVILPGLARCDHGDTNNSPGQSTNLQAMEKPEGQYLTEPNTAKFPTLIPKVIFLL